MYGRENQDIQPKSPPFAGMKSEQSQGASFLNTPNSIIGSDLVIIATDLVVISQSSLQLDGETLGEVRATEIFVGKSGKVTGTIAAESIVIDGEVKGIISAPNVTLNATARVDGEIHHNSFEIARGAVFHGQSVYHSDGSELMPKLSND